MKFITNKKAYLITALLLFTIVGGYSVARAQSGTQPAIQTSAQGQQSSGRTFTLSNPLSGVTSVGALVNKFVEILSYILIIFAVLMIVYTGLQFILARGNPEKMKEEGKRLGYILIGVALVIGARILVMVVINTLQATGTVTPQVINQANQAVQGK